MASICPHAFVEISLIEIVRPRNVHIVEACYLDPSVSPGIRDSNLSMTILHCDDLGSAVAA